jgi:hypothetical protein
VAESVDLDLADTVRMTQRFSKMIDAAWQKARSTSAPGGLVMALDEASLGLHRARIALSHSLSETAIPMTPASRRRAGWLGTRRLTDRVWTRAARRCHDWPAAAGHRQMRVRSGSLTMKGIAAETVSIVKESLVTS